MDLMGFLEAMSTSNIPLIAAFFIGLMTAISPCPLTTNIAAIAYVSKNIRNSRHTFITGITYVLGKVLTYVILASLITIVSLNIQGVSFFLQKYGELVLGPVLLFAGLVMLEVIKIDTNRMSFIANRVNKLKTKISMKNYAGSFLLGVLFTLAFCPFSALLFFGVLIPLSISNGDPIILPSIFAVATGLPVLIFSVILSKGLSRLNVILKKVQTFELWVRRIVSVIFIIIGSYYIILAISSVIT